MPDEAFLNPSEAAHMLGITPELLFAYIRNAPKTAMGDQRRLPSHQSDGQIVFLRSELEDFDRYLKEPWSRSADERPAVPTYISEYLKVESGGRCARCGKGFKVETAHIDDYSTSLSHHHHNLIRLCSGCHDDFDAKTLIPQDQLRLLKQRLIAELRERIASADSRLRAHPLSMPVLASRFVGRTSELVQLKAAINERRTILVHGAAGVGKSELVLRALSPPPPEFEVIWLDVSGFENILDIEMCLKSGLGGSSSGTFGSLASLLDERRRCVVFDGVESISPTGLDALEDWFAKIVGATRSTIFMFTSQTPLYNLDVELDIDLGPLDSADSLAILEPALTETDPEMFDIRATSHLAAPIEWLLDFSAGHALTLRLVSGLLRYFRSPSVVVDRIQHFGTKALNNPTRTTQTKNTSLALALRVAYSFLSPEEQRLAYILSECPAGYQSEHLKFFDFDDQDAAIAALRRWHFLNVYPYGLGKRLAVLSPIRTFVEESYEVERSDHAANAFLKLTRNITMQALVLSHKHIQTDDIAYGILRFSHEFPNFLHVLLKAHKRKDAHPEYLQSVGALATSMQVFCFVSGVWRRGAEIMRIGANASRELGMHASESALLLHSLVLLLRTGDYSREHLADLVDEIDRIARDNDNSQLAGNAAMARGELLSVSGDLVGAYAEFKSAELHYKEDQPEGELDPNDHLHMLSLALMNQGKALEHTKRWSEALSVYEQAIVLMRQDSDMLNLGSVLHQTGNCHCDLHEYPKALEAYLNAADIFCNIGVRGHLSNSVTEIGYLLIEWSTDTDLRESLSVSLLEICGDDIIAEVSSCFLSRLPAKLNDRACLGAIRKIVGLIAVLSYIPAGVLLQAFAEDLRESIVRPIIARLGPSVSRPRSHDDILIMYVDVLTAVCGSVRAIPPAQAKRDRDAVSEIEHLARMCYRLFDHAWEAFRVFAWLSMYVRRSYGVQISADEILATIKDTEESGAEFRLHDFQM